MARLTQHTKGRITAAWISILYALLAGLWVFASDTLVYLIAENSQQLATIQFYKSFLFIGTTTLLLFILINRTLNAITGEQRSLDNSANPSNTQTAPVFPSFWQDVRIPILIFVLLASAIVGAGYLGYLHQKSALQQEQRNELSTIADTKTQQIAHWLLERQHDARAFASDPFFAREAGRWLTAGAPGDSRAEELLHYRLSALKKAYDYAVVALLDKQGQVRLSTDENALDNDVQTLARRAFNTNQIEISDLHQHGDATPAKPVIDVVAPLNSVNSPNQQPIGAIYFQIDPQQYLFPLMQSWPTPSDSAEILIVRQEQNTILFLNELRHRKHAALTFRLPLRAKQLPAAMAARGQEGFVEGLDYRQVPVFAVVRSVPNSDWFLVAKVDAQEVYASLNTLARLMALLVGVFIISAGAGLSLWWQQQRAQFLADHYRHQLDRQALVQHFDYLAKYGNDIVFLMDESGHILEANDRAVSTYGYPRHEFLRLTIKDLRAPETLGTVDEQLHRIKREGGVLFETLHRRKDGSTFPVEVNGRFVKIQGKNFLDSIVRDISERKQAEAALRASETRYRILFDQAPDSILLIDLKTAAIVDFNDKAYETLGYTREELTKLNVAAIEALETSEEVTRHTEKIIAAGSDNFETKHRTKGGDLRDMLVSSHVIEIDGNTLIQSICRDITERKRLENQMRRQELQLVQADKMAAIGILVSGVAHEINNPNQMMQMNAQSLLNTWVDLVDLLDDRLDEEENLWVGNIVYKELRETFPMLLQDIADGAARIQKIVAELRDFARPSDNILPTSFNLNDLIHRALDLLSHAIKKKTQRLQVDLDPDLPLLVGNPQQIEQVIVNLVLNALDALPDGSRGIRLSTRSDWATNRVELKVEDEGIGIPPEHLERILEPFFTTKQDQGGTGLGLFITYKLIIAHGGALSFSSKPGQGTVAQVKLPLISNIHYPHHDSAPADYHRVG